jgi:hypothetical protein
LFIGHVQSPSERNTTATNTNTQKVKLRSREKVNLDIPVKVAARRQLISASLGSLLMLFSSIDEVPFR